MHTHCEVYSPDFPGDPLMYILEVMEPYNYHNGDSGDDAFFDWLVIGGRWSGSHTLAQLDPKKLGEFKNICVSREFFRNGRQNEIDFLFKMYFPEVDLPAPYGRDAYRDWGYPDDIIDLAVLPDSFKCHTLVVPGVGYWHVEEFDSEKEEFITTEFGFQYQGRVKPFLREQLGITSGYLITVDYHF